MSLNLEMISSLLFPLPTDGLPADGRTRAAVAMIMREGVEGPELLFIERASHEFDPWSGDLAFPGGKVEEGEDARQAAERETSEEIGLDLVSARYLGWLTEITGARLPVRVSCFVYGIGEMDVAPVLNKEVHDLFWVRLSDLMADERRIIAQVRFADKEQGVPAIRLPHPGKPVLWGLTYRLVIHLLELLPLPG